MAEGNGNGRDREKGDIVLDVTALKVKVSRLEKEHDTHEDILQTLADTQSRLSERVITLEVQNENDSEVLKKLQKETSLQTKLLGGILTALIAAAIKALFHL